MVIWLLSKKILIGKILGTIWLVIFGLVLLVGIAKWFHSKTVLDKNDYYGHYVINREYFKGAQADWQYNHFRFEIKENDSIYFYETDNETILKTHKGKISVTEPYKSARLILTMQTPTHHIVASNPTIYRSAWNFYLVFKSSKFNNMFFKKGKWQPIKQ